ncbi:MAG: MATE family efflux transporter [Spirochaetaceae bacterium]|nr:MATE family efflux transporter [Spirochaetaceae bacterium]
MAQTTLSAKDAQFREFSLNGNMLKVIAKVCTPLALFQTFNHFFNILDTLMASHISAAAVSTVAYLAQIQLIISAIGQGLASGSSIKISEAYGAGDYVLVQKRLSTLIVICLCLALCTSLILPFTPQILQFLGTPETFITLGTTYFNITLIGTLLSFVNNVYIAIERARGNSKRILRLNMAVIITKISLTAIFIYGFQGGITMIAIATVIAQSVMFIFAIRNLTRKNDVFSFALHCVELSKEIVLPLLKISFPVMIERISFQFGKSVVNSMSTNYGELTVGALGISNNINGIATSSQSGLQDGGSAIISQNRGGNKKERTILAFKHLLIINMIVGFLFWVILNLLIESIGFVFASSTQGVNVEFQQMIVKIFRYDSFGGCLPLGVSSACMAFLFGYGYTKLTLIINFCRVFVYRIPVLWLLQNFTNLGSESVGIMMAISNIFVAIHGLITVFVVIRKMKKKEQIDSALRQNEGCF